VNGGKWRAREGWLSPQALWLALFPTVSAP